MDDDAIQVRFHPDPPEEGGYSITEMRPDFDVVDDIVGRVADAEGDLCIAFTGNVGATPWLRPTPYRNHDGVLVKMWSCISVFPKAMPGRTMLFGRRRFIWPDEYGAEGGYNVRMFTREWVWNEVRKATHVEVHPAEESPFTTDWWDWHWEERVGPDWADTVSGKGLEAVYEDRNLLAAALAAASDAPAGWTPDEEQPAEWAIVWVETPHGQVSWHVPRPMAERLEVRRDDSYEWDGHDRERKNDVLAGWTADGCPS